jgi:4-amino-4-deoxy-L-arabinose transferase-like glycosyltransferase
LVPLLVGAGLRLIYLCFFPQREPHNDDLFYWQAAQAIAEGRGYVAGGQPSVAWMPGMSLLLAPVAFLFGGAVFPMRLLLVALSVLTIPIVWKLSRAWLGETCALWAAWAFALFPPFWFFGSAILSETPSILLVAVALLLLTELKGGFEWKRAVGLGLCYGGLMYFKPEFVFWGPFLGLSALLWRREVTLRTVLLVGTIGVLLLGPWIGRNWIRFHEFIPLKASGGYLVWWVSQDPPVEALDERTPEQLAMEASFVVPGKPGATGKNAARAGMARIKEHPLQYLKRCFTRRLVHLFLGSQTEAATGVGLARSFADLRASQERARLAIKLLLFALQGLICALGLIGVALYGSNTVRLLFFGMVGTYMMLLGIPRYSMVLMPFLIPHAAALVERARLRLRSV